MRRRKQNEPDRWSSDYIVEHAYLVARGVRPMAIVGHVEATGAAMLAASSRLEVGSVSVGAVPFVVPRGDGMADCGFAAAAWVVDLYMWLVQSTVVPPAHAHRVRGLLLGYSADAIRAHDERGSGRRFISSSAGPASTSPIARRPDTAETRAPSERRSARGHS